MVLNLLKKNKISRNSALLYHNPNIRRQSKYEFAACDGKSLDSDKKSFSERFVNGTKKDVPLRNIAESSFESSCDDDGIFDENNVSQQKRDKANLRIKTLMNEISDLLNSEDYSSKRLNTMTEMYSDSENNTKHNKLPDKTISNQTSFEQRMQRKNKSDKFPLDIQELHNVAAMAKRLRAKSKLRKSTI